MKFHKLFVTSLQLFYLLISPICSAFALIKVYTRILQTVPTQVTVYDSLVDSIRGFCSNCPNYLIIHGWGDGKTEWMEPIKNELFRLNTNINVFMVDWSAGSNTMSLDISELFGYERAIKNINVTVREIHAHFREYIKRGYINKIRPNIVDIHCIKNLNINSVAFLKKKTKLYYTKKNKLGIGYSLGGHVCGLTGKLMKKSNVLFSRITALDPAGPCFDGYAAKNRLHINDAEYVDVIHTSKTFGYRKRLGHSDFYPHDGN